MKIDFSKSPLNKTEKQEFKNDVTAILDVYPVLKDLHVLVEFSNKMVTSAGNVSLKDGNFTIRISTKNVKTFGFDRGLKTLRHEFAHILDFLKNRKFSHGYDFKVICEKLGGSMNNRMAGVRFANCATDSYIETPFKYEYRCPCGNTIQRKGKIRKIYGYSCIKCGTKVASMTMVKL